MVKSILCVFAKLPLPGQTKSRLSLEIGDELAASLSRIMLLDIIHNAGLSDFDEIQLWITPGSSKKDFENAGLELNDVIIKHQIGGDLGARMNNAFRENLGSSTIISNMVIVGSDCIGVDRDVLNLSISSLIDVDVIIQPAEDGGYVLIGMKKLVECLFKDISWGGEDVFSQSKNILDTNKISYQLLKKSFDIDFANDLKKIARLNLTNHPNLQSWLQSNKEKVDKWL